MRKQWMLCGTLLVSGLAFADMKAPAKKAPPIKDAFSNQGKGYGMAGCGLGGMVFGNKSGFIQVVAVTLNSSFGSQTFGISSGTSGCGKSGKASAAMYIESNRDALAREAARGEGSTLAGLSRIMGCHNSQAFGRAIQRSYTNVFGDLNVSSDKMVEAIDSAVKNDSAVACS